MLKEYILDHMESARTLMTKKMKVYKQVCETETVLQENIEKLQKDGNIDFEIFSPRMEERSIRGKMNEYYTKLHEVQEKKTILKKEIDEISEELDKFRIMAAELMALDKQARANKK